MKALTTIIFLFVAQEAFPQFNSIGFQKKLASVKIIQSKEFLPKTEEIGIKSLSHRMNPVVKESRILLASPPLEDISMTSRYGYRLDPFSGERKFHRGIDLKANSSQILSMLRGKVIAAGYNPLLGNFVKIRHGKYEAVYGHLSQIHVVKGDHVLPGSLLGISGSTGKATGDHLHLTIKKGTEYINPSLFIQVLSKLSTSKELIEFLTK